MNEHPPTLQMDKAPSQLSVNEAPSNIDVGSQLGHDILTYSKKLFPPCSYFLLSYFQPLIPYYFIFPTPIFYL